jgi:uncharacterized sulfatase
VPFIVRSPSGARGAVSQSLVSHLDILPTMLEAADIEQPEMLTGASLLPVLDNPVAQVRDHAIVSFHRFAINNDAWGQFYPIRCITDGRHKLVINLFESDELYDLEEDPYELDNVLAHPAYRETRDELHDRLLEEMDRIRDPFRTFRWGDRSWRRARKNYYLGGTRGNGRGKPAGFPFQVSSA